MCIWAQSQKIEGDLQPGAMIQALFKNVRFPCAPKAFVTATADCGMSVPNNAG